MAQPHSISRPRKVAFTALGLGVAAATVLSGCTDAGGGGGETSGGTVVPYGASAAEYQAALADMEPVELIMQSGANAGELRTADPYHAFMDYVTEYSGGKITFDVTYANGIVSNVLEFDDALVDGRFDFSLFWPQYDPAEYPATNALIEATVLRDPQLVTGWFGGQAAMQEIGLGTSEVVAEWMNKGILPLNVLGQDGVTLIACREPWTSLADLQGKQVRAGGTVHARQLDELGMIPVSLPYPEVYEALQRGILDCSMSAHLVASSAGHLEVAPYVLHTETVSFASTPTNFYAGPRVLTLPPVAQQLIVEAAQQYVVVNMVEQMNNIVADVHSDSTLGQVERFGGQWLSVDQDVEDRLAEINAGILADLEGTSQFDGAEFVERAETVYAKWNALVNELGYTDDGPIGTMPDWYTEERNFDRDTWVNAVVSEILANYSPV